MKTAIKRCSQKGCQSEATTSRFCRFHYIAHWRPSRVRAEDKLNYYIREITRRYPHEYLEIIKQNLSNPESFKKSLKELHIEGDEKDQLLKKIKRR